MKKLALVLVLLLCVALTGVFAEVDASVYAEAGVTFGVNLDTMKTGLQNDVYGHAQLKFGEDTKTEAGEGIYGSLSISNFRITQRYRMFQDGTGKKEDWNVSDPHGVSHWLYAPTVTARIHFGPALWVRVDGNEAVRSRQFDWYSGSKIHDFSILTYSQLATSYAYYGQVTAGYTHSMFNVAVRAASNTGWEAVLNEAEDAIETDADNAYSVLGLIGITAVPNLNVGLSVVKGFGYAANPLGLGAKATYTMPLTDVIKLAPFASFDAQIREAATETMSWQVGGGVALNWGKGWQIDGALEYFFGGYYKAVSEGLALNVQYYDNVVDKDTNLGTGATVLNLELSAYDRTLVENLGYAVLFEMGDLLGTATTSKAMGIGLYADYAIGDVTPYGWFKYTTDDLTMSLGASVAPFDYVTFTLDYTSGNLLMNGAGDGLNAKLGAVTLQALVTLF